jgi:hypothetical protein
MLVVLELFNCIGCDMSFFFWLLTILSHEKLDFKGLSYHNVIFFHYFFVDKKKRKKKMLPNVQ